MDLFGGVVEAMLRSLVAVLRRDLVLKYQHTLLGPCWTMGKPWLQVWALYLLFSTLARMSIMAVPSVMVIYLAVIIWQFFVSTLSDGGLALVTNPTLIQRIRFPIFVLPLSSACFYFLELLAHLFAGVVLLWWRDELVWSMLWVIPNVLLATFLLSAGLAMMLSPLNHYFKDIRFLMPLVFQIGFILTPVAGSLPQLMNHPTPWLKLNPLMLLINQLCLLSSQAQDTSAANHSFWFWAMGGVLLGYLTLKSFEQKGRQ